MVGGTLDVFGPGGAVRITDADGHEADITPDGKVRVDTEVSVDLPGGLATEDTLEQIRQRAALLATEVTLSTVVTSLSTVIAGLGLINTNTDNLETLTNAVFEKLTTIDSNQGAQTSPESPSGNGTAIGLLKNLRTRTQAIQNSTAMLDALLSTRASEATLAAVVTELQDAATEDTLAAVLAALAGAATEDTLAARASEATLLTRASESTLADVLAALSGVATEGTLATRASEATLAAVLAEVAQKSEPGDEVAEVTKVGLTPYAEILTGPDSIVPASGKRVQVAWVQVIPNPDNTVANAVTVEFDGGQRLYSVYAVGRSATFTGEVDQALLLTPATSQPVSVNVQYREVD